MGASFAFDRFVLDTRERRLKLDERPVELNARYLDALALMVREPGKLVSKDQFMDEVWRGVPVTDEALTQCIRTLRRQLGDDASRPRFIETVPKHGYRFIAPVEVVDAPPRADGNSGRASEEWREFVVTGVAGTLGGTAAGAIGGLIYGFAAASNASGGGISVLLVLLCVTTLVAVIGAAGVSFAIATFALARTRQWTWLTLAGAAGGLFVGAFGKLLGHDSFGLLVGRSPADITGAMEGLLVGAGVGLGAWLALRTKSLRLAMSLAGLTGAAAGIVISLLGGRLMFGSLEVLAAAFPGSRLRLEPLVRLFGAGADFAATTLEAALFSACVVGAMTIARRRFARS